MRQLSACLVLLAFALGFSSLVGCGDGRGNVVTGTVQLKGDNVGGDIIFKGPSGKESKAPILAGKYTVDKVELGTNKITIVSPDTMYVDVKGLQGKDTKVKMPEMPGGAGDGKKEVPAPKKYATGGIPDFEVKGSRSENNITLEP